MSIHLKRIGRWFLVGFLTLLVVATILGVLGARALNASRYFQPPSLTIPSDSASIAAGQKWATSLCTGCHGENYAGKMFMESAALGTTWAPNLTPTGIGKDYSDADWVRAIRYGLRNTGQPFIIMPSENLQHLSDEHLGQLIAYLKTLPAVEAACPKRQLTFFSSIMYQLGAFGKLPADKVDRTSTHRIAPEKAVSNAYGQYLCALYACSMCHGPDFKGGTSPDVASPPCPDISASSAISQWNEQDFLTAMRTGRTPSGKALNPKFMPWQEYGRLDDVQLRAIQQFIKSYASK